VAATLLCFCAAALQQNYCSEFVVNQYFYRTLILGRFAFASRFCESSPFPDEHIRSCH
jgi:hypothetical protein